MRMTPDVDSRARDELRLNLAAKFEYPAELLLGRGVERLAEAAGGGVLSQRVLRRVGVCRRILAVHRLRGRQQESAERCKQCLVGHNVPPSSMTCLWWERTESN